MKKTYFICPAKGKISREEGFLGGGGGNVFSRKRGLESFWGKCLKQIRVSDNVSFIHNHPSMSTYAIEMLHGKNCIRENLYTGKNQEQYIAEKGEKTYFICQVQKGRFPGKRVFLGGNIFPRKRGLERFWGKCLQQIQVSDNVSFINIHPSMSTYTIEMLHGKICIRENLYTGKNQEQ